MAENISKKYGGQERADKARKDMEKIFSDPTHSLYLEKDIDLAKKYDVSRLTIYNIREQLKIPPRTDRILSRLKSVNSKLYTKKELADLLCLKYQNLYKIIRIYNIKFKEDTPPIVSMIKHQKEKRAEKTLESKKVKKTSESKSISKNCLEIKAK